MSRDKRFRPKTQPTGFPAGGSSAARPPAPAAADAGLARLVKVAYVLERRRWEALKTGTAVPYVPPAAYDGTEDETVDGELVVTRGRPSAWQQIVDWCQARDYPPQEYVRAAFTDLPLRQTAPEPRQLLGPVYARKWAAVAATLEQRLTEDLLRQAEAARTAILVNCDLYGYAPARAHRIVLTDSFNELSPLFRYCTAVSLDTPQMRKVSQTFAAEAVLQFKTFPRQYAKTWGDFLPRGFAAFADEAYPKVLARIGIGG